MANIRFLLNGYNFNFIAEAPEDITLKELFVQTNKIKSDDGYTREIYSFGLDSHVEHLDTEIFITKDSVRLANENIPVTIMENGDWFK